MRCLAHARHAASGVRLRPQVCLTTNKEEFHEMREYREALEGTLEQALWPARAAFAVVGASATAAALASADVGGVRPVPVQLWQGMCPIPVQMWQGVSPIPVQMWQGVSPIPVQMWQGRG